MTRNVLAIDLGASTGRVMKASFDGQKLELLELRRFENNPVMLRENLYWDFLRIFHEIGQGILTARKYGFDSLAVDTWGVDFGLLDKNGDLLENPVHYRDNRTRGLIPEVQALSVEDLHLRTGTQIMELNTIFQLYSLTKYRPDLLDRASGILLMPDLFGYFLTGEKTAEYSIASTTQLLNPLSLKWDTELIKRMGISQNLFPEVRSPGCVLGSMLPNLRRELNVSSDCRIISVAGHDTQSAIAAVPSAENDFLYNSCGTWSLLGTELKKPIISQESGRLGITNEVGYGGVITFLKNICGLWIVQELKRQYQNEGKNYSYAEMAGMADNVKPFSFFIDPDATEFSTPGDMAKEIAKYCQRTGQGTPESDGAVIRCVYESIAMKYRTAVEQIQSLTGKKYPRVYMVGGGINNKLLCRMASSSTGLPVTAGPAEATAIGNAAVQLMALGDLGGQNEIRNLVSASFPSEEYEPENLSQWEEMYEKFNRITSTDY
jgi:rhamnulokinase/L-fuculokinase